MAGSPPHLDLFDYKPELVRHTGENCPESFLRGRRFAFTSGVPKLLGTPQRFAQHGRAGRGFPRRCRTLPTIADELCFIKSMHTEQFNHAPAELLLFTGSPQFGRPSMGSWVTYGLGSESQDLPGFIVLVSSGTFPSAGNSDWNNGFLPSVYQGVQCRSQGDPVLYVSNPNGMDRGMRRLSLDALRDLNEMQAAELGSPETRTRIAQYELAFRMQTAVPGSDGHHPRTARRHRRCMAPSPAAPASPTIACWPAGWSSTACASCSFTIGAGTFTAPAPARRSRTACATKCRTHGPGRWRP